MCVVRKVEEKVVTPLQDLLNADLSDFVVVTEAGIHQNPVEYLRDLMIKGFSSSEDFANE